ncbi:MAG: sigma-70 family RNA polymerase sigma factor [Anaerolineales bacterium]|nr:sigma-70 family RNA polymerase sigma factor [Anaerolineales bacterium]HEY61627.1 sigma-70 family RNA polymerase sigma factor [Anaerolineae bacterium]
MTDDKVSENTFDIEALRAGEKGEFTRLVEAYSGSIYRLALKMLQDSQDAEDVLQETFIKVLNKISTFRGASNISTWIYRIATNEALMLLRRRKLPIYSADESFQIQDNDEQPKELEDWCCLPEKELMNSESRAYLDESIKALPYSLRIVFLLRDIEGFSTRQTAEILDITETAVKTRLSRGRMRLRELLSVYYGKQLKKLD